jgi:hypothetical protein
VTFFVVIGELSTHWHSLIGSSCGFAALIGKLSDAMKERPSWCYNGVYPLLVRASTSYSGGAIMCGVAMIRSRELGGAELPVRPPRIADSPSASVTVVSNAMCAERGN